jgi:hypothetical protein
MLPHPSLVGSFLISLPWTGILILILTNITTILLSLPPPSMIILVSLPLLLILIIDSIIAEISSSNIGASSLYLRLLLKGYVLIQTYRPCLSEKSHSVAIPMRNAISTLLETVTMTTPCPSA